MISYLKQPSSQGWFTLLKIRLILPHRHTIDNWPRPSSDSRQRRFDHSVRWNHHQKKVHPVWYETPTDTSALPRHTRCIQPLTQPMGDCDTYTRNVKKMTTDRWFEKNKCRRRMKFNTHHQGKDILHSMLKFFPSPRAVLNGRCASVFPWFLRFLEGRLEKKSTRRHIPSSQMTTVDTVHRISFFYCWRHEVRLLTLKSDDDLDVRCGLIYRARLWFYYSSQLYYRMEWSGSSWSKKNNEVMKFFYFLWVICSS